MINDRNDQTTAGLLAGCARSNRISTNPPLCRLLLSSGLPSRRIIWLLLEFFELLYSLIFWLFFCAEDVTGIVSYIQSRDVAYRIAIFKIRPTGTGTGYL